MTFWNRCHLLSRKMRQGFAISVAVDELDRDFQRQQQLDAFAGHRTREHVTADDDRIRCNPPNVDENSLERRQVSVDIAKNGDPHLFFQRADSACSGGCRPCSDTIKRTPR